MKLPMVPLPSIALPSLSGLLGTCALLGLPLGAVFLAREAFKRVQYVGKDEQVPLWTPCTSPGVACGMRIEGNPASACMRGLA